MHTAPDNHDAHDYAERIRERLPRALRELREAATLSMYALEKKSGVSREMIRCIDEGAAIPTFHGRTFIGEFKLGRMSAAASYRA